MPMHPVVVQLDPVSASPDEFQASPPGSQKTLKETVMDFLAQHKIIESLPDNA